MSLPHPVNILVVDDEPAALVALEAALASVDCMLVTARSGSEALKCVLEQDFAVIVLDIFMPVMDGFETASLIRGRERSRLTPIIFLTADNQVGARTLEAYRLGAADYMYKPFAPFILRSKVRVFVELFRKTMALEEQATELTGKAAELAEREKDARVLNTRLDDQVLEQGAAFDAAILELEAAEVARARAAEAFGAAEERNRLALQAAAMGIWHVDMATGVCIWSDVAGHLAGLPVDAPNTLDAFLGVVRTDERQTVQKAIAHAVKTDSEFGSRFPVVWADASVHWLESKGRAVKDASGRATQLTGTLRDISDQMAAEQAMRQSESRLQGLVQSAMDAIVSVDELERIVLFNAAAERLFGYTADQAMGQPLQMLLPDRFRAGHSHLIKAFAETGVTTRGMGQQTALAARRADGTEFPIEAAISQVVLDDGRLFTVILRDITERLEADRQREGLARSEKLRALGQMASGIAHDLNQSLMLVASYSDLARYALAQSPPNLAEVDGFLTMSTQAALDGGETVKRLLQFTRAAPEHDGKVVDLRSVIDDAAQMTAPRWRDAAQAEGRPIRLRIEAAEHLTIRGYPEQLREMMTNLIFNAVDALPTGGTIRLLGKAENGLGIVEVADSGIGMSAEIQERVFEPFYTTKGDGGTGLGLAMVFGIVERHRGHIDVRSAPGEGTTFRMSFPLVADATVAERTQPEVVPRLETASRLRILVVDDEPRINIAVVRMLQPHHLLVEAAVSGEEAIEKLAEQPYDVVISDLGMGAGMNGWELAEVVRRRWPAVRFMLATGWGAAIDLEDARAKGVQAILAKPYKSAELLNALTTIERAA